MVYLQRGNEVEQDEDKERPLPLLPVLKVLHAAWLPISASNLLKWAQPTQQALKESLQPGLLSIFASLIVGLYLSVPP